MNLSFEKPTLSQIPEMQQVVLKEIQNGIILNRSNDEVATNIRSYTIVRFEGNIIGFCALHIHSMNLAEIRSLVISEEYRGQSIGQQLIDVVLKEAKALNVAQVLTLTYKQSFFEKLGFRVIEKESIPEHKIWADCIKCKHFPRCDEISLIKDVG